MQTLKRLFVVPYLLACLLAGAHSVWHILSAEQVALAWYGAAVALLPMLGFMVYLAIVPTARTSRYMWIQLSGALLGGGLAVVELQPIVPVLYALLLGLGGVLSYIFWYSLLDRGENSVLRPGQLLPEFELEDADGNAVSSRRFQGRKLLMMFYRGNWCPLCVAQVREVAERYRELEARGVNVVMISPQPHKNTRKIAEKFDVPMQFYVDRDNRAASALQIAHKGGIALGISGYGADTVYPTVVITDEQGKILYADLTDNYRVRPEPDAFIDFLDSGVAGA
ncbi:MAG: hypothetical protein CMN85_09390 [Spongiibacteraceae bacterium]|nr:hypothetical protein [Spongiibacteraceae bacterium]|tara:strand:- start:117 stop:959 length:843 start_codon:yes stop_codon:yes gene_type:complete